MPETSITLSSPDGTAYTGNKGGIDPDGAGDCAAYGYGTDCIFWGAFGLTGNIGGAGNTSCWIDQIAGIGTDTDGESGVDAGDPGSCSPCDGMLLLEIPVTVAAGPGSTTVVVRTTYGCDLPGCPVSCPWDTAQPGDPVPGPGTPDGVVGINDLLHLLANWGPCDPGPCPWDTAQPGDPVPGPGTPDGVVGINDLLHLLANWGPC
jgi:hypothetical protein